MIASRPFRTEELRRLGFLQVTIEPLGEADIQRFLRQWVATLHAQDSVRALRGEAGRYLERLEQAILARPAVRALAANPVMLTCLSVVHWNQGRLPEGRARVYRAVIYWLLHARSEQRRSEFGLGADFAERTLAQLALECMGGQLGKRSVVDLVEAAEIVSPAFERHRPELEPQERQDLARRWLLFECEGSGVIEELVGHRLRFWHLTFQEYLTALELARPTEGRDWWSVLGERLEDAQWREAVELFATCLYDFGHPDRVDRLLREVLALRRKGDLESEARIAAIIGRILPAVEVCGYRPAREIHRAYEEARVRVMEIFGDEGARRVPIKLRIAAAEALGRGGDPRFVPEIDNFLEVPGLVVKLGKYPVTVEEYQRFAELRGYNMRRFWDDEGWAVKEKQGWRSPGNWFEQLKTPNCPVVEVSWYEAVAYCRWLSNLRRQVIRLLNETEWEKSAAHPRGPYPWGNVEPDQERANFNESNVGHATPVGVYPSGRGPHGHLDLGGNVWEWCSDRIVLGDYEAAPRSPLRGGSWWDPALRLRSAVRNWVWRGYRDATVGFRVALVSQLFNHQGSHD